jgi:hypothetical protein
MSLSLATITTDLEQLIADREEVLAGETCSVCMGSGPLCEECKGSGRIIDGAALLQIDDAIRQYSQELLPAKADAYWFTLKKIGQKDDWRPLPEQNGLIADAKREIKRLEKLIEDWDALQSMLREYALDAMRQRNTKVLEGTNGRKLKRQANGGVQGVDVRQPELVPMSLKRVALIMPEHLWDDIHRTYLAAHNADDKALAMLLEVVRHQRTEPDLIAIGEALRNGQAVPGCVLKERGEHLRAS